MIKILFVGSGNHHMYEISLYKASIRNVEIESDTLLWNKFIDTRKIIDRFQNKFSIGYKVKKINRILIDKINSSDFDIVFLYTSRLIYSSTVRQISKKSFIAIYNNDDPFSKYFPRYFWRHFIKSIKYSKRI